MFVGGAKIEIVKNVFLPLFEFCLNFYFYAFSPSSASTSTLTPAKCAAKHSAVVGPPFDL